ncbi:MAG: hypothetical protein ACK5XV_05195 [Flavobacteriales bacterium]|jgi:hypothetical protein
MSNQPEALRLAELFELEDDPESQYRKAAALLRRQHAEHDVLRAEADKERDWAGKMTATAEAARTNRDALAKRTSNLREDWCLLQATQESLREHAAEIHRLQAELASMHTCFEAAGRERSELRERAERAEAGRDALRANAERYRLLRRGQQWSVIDGGGNTLRAETLDAAIDAAILGARETPRAALEKDDSVPIWETLAEIGESAPAGTWDALPAKNCREGINDASGKTK